jgi:hypothetical protein
MPSLRVAHDAGAARIVVVDSFTHCDERVGGRDVIVAGSFAGALSFGFVLPRGARGLIAHAAGVGKDGAGISGLSLAESVSLPAAAVQTLSARLGDGDSVLREGVLGHVNAVARSLGVRIGMSTLAAAHLMLEAAPGRPLPDAAVVDRNQHVALETPRGRVMLLGSTSFATTANRRDVLCAGSHGGRVNALPLLPIRPRAVICFDGGLAKERSGLSGLPVCDEAGIAAATVDVGSARIGEPLSLWETGVISAGNQLAIRAGVTVGQPAQQAARAMLAACP